MNDLRETRGGPSDVPRRRFRVYDTYAKCTIPESPLSSCNRLSPESPRINAHHCIGITKPAPARLCCRAVEFPLWRHEKNADKATKYARYPATRAADLELESCRRKRVDHLHSLRYCRTIGMVEALAKTAPSPNAAGWIYTTSREAQVNSQILSSDLQPSPSSYRGLAFDRDYRVLTCSCPSMHDLVPCRRRRHHLRRRRHARHVHGLCHDRGDRGHLHHAKQTDCFPRREH